MHHPESPPTHVLTAGRLCPTCCRCSAFTALLGALGITAQQLLADTAVLKRVLEVRKLVLSTNN